jgi:hypothetical protein
MIQRRTPLKRSSKPLRRTPLARVSKKRRKEAAVYAKKRKAFLARFNWCQMCEDVPPTDVHHSAKRHGALLNDETKWFALCRKCHERIHSHPSEARAKGWLA